MSNISAVDIRVNNLVFPLGICDKTPEFSWQVINAQQQSAYRIVCAASESDLFEENFLWDSGRVISGKMSGIVYGGKELKPQTGVFFRIQLTDENNTAGNWSDINYFETALMTEQDFDAQWVGFPAGWSGHALAFQKKFELEKIPRKARLYVAASMADCFINGSKLTDSLLQPAVTDYQKSYHILTFDVTEHLKEGTNTLFFHVGSGWYGMPVIKYRLDADDKNITRSQPLDLPMVYKSPVFRHSIYGGEEYDNTKALDMLETLPANKAALRVYGPQGTLRGFEEEPIIRQQEITPVSWQDHSDGSTTVDFGRNFTGWCRLKIQAPSGTKITMRFAEQLYDSGRINQENLQGDYSTDVFISSGKNEPEIFEPNFTYHGFRYVEISGLPCKFTADMLTGIVLRSNCRRTGYFKCSNKMLNDMFEMMLHTEESNLLAVPTDCPQRTERMGWLNDMLARNEGALYLFDVSNIYTKYLRDISEAQDPQSGDVPMTAPFYWGFEVDPVCSSFLETALNSFKFYGKTAQLHVLYQQMKKYVEYLLNSRDTDGILRKGGFVGDWCPPLCFNGPEESPQNKSVPHGLVSTALMFYAVRMLKDISKIISIQDDFRFDDIMQKIRQDFAAEFMVSPNRLKVESMAGYSIAICLGLIDETECSCAAERLAELFAENNFKHTTGNICTKYLFEVLSRYGFTDHVMRLASSSDYPGWGYMIENGATTVWERWEKDDGKRLSSLNHPMHSAPCVWMFRYLAGIKLLPESMGADTVELSPEFPETLDFVEAVYDSRSGRYCSKWKREANRIIWDFTIPCNCRAKVKTADGSFKVYFSGSYQIVFDIVR